MVRILLVDDDTDLLFLVAEYLELRGIDCETAENASQARDRLKHSVFDMVISDFNMPCESGLDLFRSTSSKYPGMPFILMSGSVDPSLKHEAIRMGVADFIEKPFVFRDLVDSITSLARSKARPVIKISTVQVLAGQRRAGWRGARGKEEKRVGSGVL